ncbi:MAG: NAD-dependent epimerase/dehydratase family protein [Bacteroidales bacterium]|nr:NAD-dependent epimerase/dehydratase family protein [Bacteroidales bacterium]
MQTILITGGNGFLASNIIKKLIHDHNIVVLEKNIKSLSRLSSVRTKLAIYDFDNDALEKIFDHYKVDIILHTATIYGRNNEALESIINTNLLLPLRLFSLGLKNKVKVFINTDTVLDRTMSPYALSKAQIRDWLQMFANECQVINVQLEHFYGPGGSKDNFITLMIKKMLNNTPVIDLTKGEQERDFIYYTDIVDAFILLINSLDKHTASFTNYEVSSGELITIRALVEKIKDMTGSLSNLNFGVLPYRENELLKSTTNNEAIRRLGWRPKVPLVEGLLETINYYKII